MAFVPPLPTTLPLEETLTEAGYFRIVRTAFSALEPGFRATTTYRFDAPDQSFETLYCARDFKTCFLETVVRDRPDLNIPKSEYDSRSVVLLLLDTSKLRLVSLHGNAAIRMRLDFSDLMWKKYEYTQALSKSIHDHTDAPDGIVYKARFDPEAKSVVLFNRAQPHVRLFPGSKPVEFKDARELCDAVRATVPFSIV